MNNNRKLPRKWLYIYIVIAISALIVCIVGLLKKELIIAAATGLVFGAQVINIVRWKKKQT